MKPFVIILALALGVFTTGLTEQALGGVKLNSGLLIKASVAPGSGENGTLEISFVDYSGTLTRSAIKTGIMNGFVQDTIACPDPARQNGVFVDYLFVDAGTRDLILFEVPAVFSAIDANASSFQNTAEILLDMFIRTGPGYQRLMTLRIPVGGLKGTTIRSPLPGGGFTIETPFHSVSFTAENVNQATWQSYLALNPGSCLPSTLVVSHGQLAPLAGLVQESPGTLVSIDIKPGTSPNDINLGSRGTVPVAILSSSTFDARTVDPRTVTLANAPVALSGKPGAPIASTKDVNADGFVDLVVHVEAPALKLIQGDTVAVLQGKTFGGVDIRGIDSVRIVP